MLREVVRHVTHGNSFSVYIPRVYGRVSCFLEADVLRFVHIV